MRTKPLLRAVAVASLVAALGSFAVAWRSGGGQRHLVPFSARASGVPTAIRDSSPNAAVPGGSTGRRTRPSPPVRVVIPAIGLFGPPVPPGPHPPPELDMR